jgi:hypothetical protein
LIENLISQFVLHGDVDANQVFLMGYSHGGYGAFAIGPKIPHRFAAIHSSAAAPTDGQITPKTLRSTRFTFMVGEKDTAYGRRERCEKFNESVQALRGDRIDIYPVEFLYQPGFGHGGLPDRDILTRMLPYRRNPVPHEIDWEMTDSVVKDFFWLSIAEAAKGREISARLPSMNQLIITTRDVGAFDVWLDERLVNVDINLEIQFNGQTTSVPLRPTLQYLCESIARRRDPDLAFGIKITLGQ